MDRGPEGRIYPSSAARIYQARQRAALAVNQEMLRVYWQIGHDLSVRREEWGAAVIDDLP